VSRRPETYLDLRAHLSPANHSASLTQASPWGVSPSVHCPSPPAMPQSAAAPLGYSLEHLQPGGAVGVFPCAREPTRAPSRIRSGWIPCSWPPRAEPHRRPHRAKPQAATAGSGAPARITRRVCYHAGYSRLVASCVAATSSPRADMQPSCRRL
jgi:hypothetical protein